MDSLFKRGPNIAIPCATEQVFRSNEGDDLRDGLKSNIKSISTKTFGTRVKSVNSRQSKCQSIVRT
jgi:hypothetical protein